MGKETLRLVIATDLHYLSSALRDDGEAFDLMTRFSDGALTGYGDEIFDAFLYEIKELRPDAVLITGDLSFNGEKKSHEHLAEGFESLWEEDIPVLLFPGNHDINNPMAGSYIGSEALPSETVTKDEFCAIYAVPSYHAERFMMHDTSSMSYVYALSDDLWLMCVDVNANGMPGVLTDRVLSWAESVLDEAEKKGAAVIGVTHQNLMAHNGLFSAGFVMEGAKRLLDLYCKYGVRLNLSGHMHIQHIKEEEGVTEIVTSSLFIPPCQYGILDIGKDLAVYNSRIMDVSRWAEKNAVTDPALINFSDLAASSYQETQKRRLKPELDDLGLPEEEKDELITSMGTINQAFFAGMLNSLDKRDEMRVVWKEKLPGNFWNDYMDSIFDEGIKDERSIAVPLR